MHKLFIYKTVGERRMKIDETSFGFGVIAGGLSATILIFSIMEGVKLYMVYLL